MKCLKHHAQRLATGLLLGMCALNVHFAHAATDCNAVTEIPVSECQSLLELYNSTNGANWKNKAGWNQTNKPCSWFGVICSEGRVSIISLNDNHLSGSIPNFTNLPELIWLNLSFNQLISGSVPNLNLPNLIILNLSFNQLSGSIPNFINLPKLSSLSLNSNQLSGSIPNFINLPNLIGLHLNSNQLSGIIPNFINLPNLIGLSLDRNQLSGSIPNFTTFNLANFSNAYFNNNCGLVAYDTAQETVLNKKDPIWRTRNSVCSVYYEITLNKIGNGTVTGRGTYAEGATVKLTATPDAGYKFVNWSPSPCANSFVILNNNLTCTATFALK